MEFDDVNQLDYEEDLFDTNPEEGKSLEDAASQTNNGDDLNILGDNYDDNYLEINCLEEEENFVKGQASPKAAEDKPTAKNSQVSPGATYQEENNEDTETNKNVPREKFPSSKPKANECGYRPNIKNNRQYYRSYNRSNQARKTSYGGYNSNSSSFVPKNVNFVHRKTNKRPFFRDNAPPSLFSQNLTENQRDLCNASLPDATDSFLQWQSYQRGVATADQIFSLNNRRNQSRFRRIPINQFENPSNNGFPRSQFFRNHYKHKNGNNQNFRNNLNEFQIEQNGVFDCVSETVLKNQVLLSEEKKKINLQKEARMKRFMKDFDSPDCEKKSIPEPNKTNSWVIAREMKDQSLRQNEILDPKTDQKAIQNIESNLDFQPVKPNSCKAFLMKKKNPFVSSSNFTQTSKLSKQKSIDLESQIQKVSQLQKQIFESFEGKFIPVADKESNSLTAIRTEIPIENMYKKDENKVSFVRTISKTFEELSTLKSKSNPFLRNISAQPALPSSPTSLFGLGNSNCVLTIQTQEESQLIGCLVKVLNIPHTTSINDVLALCGPVGQVMEMKFNMPKENSVVIRFAKASYAEKFYNLYHGQRWKDYFLNVVLV